MAAVHLAWSLTIGRQRRFRC